MTDRRTFIGSVAGGLLGSPSITLAQQPTKVPRIGVLANSEGPGVGRLSPRVARTGLCRWPQCRDGMAMGGRQDRPLSGACDRTRVAKVDLIVTSNTPATLAAKHATRTIPIVMLNSAYPDKIGLVESLAHPGGNVTGFTNVLTELAGKKQQLLKEDRAEGHARGRDVESGEPDRSHGVSGREGGRCRDRPRSNRLRCAGRTTTRRPSRP